MEQFKVVFVAIIASMFVSGIKSNSVDCTYKDGTLYPCGAKAPDGTFCNNLVFPGCNMCAALFCDNFSRCGCTCSSNGGTCEIPKDYNNSIPTLILGHF